MGRVTATLPGHGVGRPKRALAAALHGLAIDRALLRGMRAAFRNGYIRAVNYHDTPAQTAHAFEQQLACYARHFSPVDAAGLEAFLRTGSWPAPKPGLIVSFDDGLRSHAEVAAPLLERYGFVGWFFVPTGFVACPDAEQQAFASAHRIAHAAAPTGQRIAMTWEQVADISGRHVVGCHTHTHRRMDGSETDAQLSTEIVASKAMLEAATGNPVEAFCWVGGEEETYTPAAARAVREAGYRYAFTTCAGPIAPNANGMNLHRTNVESSWAPDVVLFQLSGILDVRYAGKRQRVRRVLER